MASVINTNIPSLNSQRNLDRSNMTLATSLQRLSSGLRINSAKDDAAGLAISDRMTTQIRGLNQAGRNANDAISLAQTAEGALSSVGDSLQRIRELAVQSANASNSAADRLALQNEATQLIAEIQRVSTSTSFNGVNLLDGSFTSKSFQVGADAGQTISIDTIANSQSTALGVGSSSSYVTSLIGTVANGNGLNSGDMSINGVTVGASAVDGLSAYDSRASAIALAGAINAAGTGAVAKANPTVLVGTTVTGTTAIADKEILINGVSLGAINTSATITERGAQMTAAINAKASLTGVTATFNTTTGSVTMTALDGRTIAVGTQSSATVGTSNTGLAYGSATTSNLTVANKIASGTSSATLASFGAIAAGTFFINGYDVGQAYLDQSAASAFTNATNSSVQNVNLVLSINALTSKTGVTALSTATATYTLVSATGVANEIKLAGAFVASGSGTSSATSMTGTTITQGLAASNQYVTRVLQGTINLSSTSATGLTVATGNPSNPAAAAVGLTMGLKTATLTAGAGVSALDLTTATGAAGAITIIDAALAQVNASRASLGAYQNRFAAVVSNLQTTAENVTASRSRIQDTDFAAETAQLSRSQILQQAGTAMLAQANSLPNTVLSLLK